jgi:DNA-directed RNA polymerase I subunit RPA2
MAKQTIGIPFHNITKRPESKIYRLNTPTSPFFRTRDYDEMRMDEYASGTNAIVAVMAYTVRA